jgi:hypothetical protein
LTGLLITHSPKGNSTVPQNLSQTKVTRNLSGLKDRQAGSMDNYDSVHEYYADNGLLEIPVAGPPGTPCQIVRVHAGYGIRTSSWDASKRGTPPAMPSPEDTPSGDTLLSYEINLAQPRLDVNQGGLSFAASGTYVYCQGTIASGGAVAGKVRGKEDFYTTGSFAYETPFLDVAGYVDLGTAGIVGGVLGALPPTARLVAIENQIAGKTDEIIRGVTSDSDYKYQSSIISPVFFSSSLIT